MGNPPAVALTDSGVLRGCARPPESIGDTTLLARTARRVEKHVPPVARRADESQPFFA